MTAREMIDSLSGTLLCDDRILSVPERELLANLLQRTQTQTSAPDNDVAEAITRTVGEIIAERALGVLGESMTRQLLQQQLCLVPEAKPAGDPRRHRRTLHRRLHRDRARQVRARRRSARAPRQLHRRPSPGSRPPGTSPPPISAGSPPALHRRSFTGITPAGHKSAANLIRDHDLATEDGRSRRSRGGRLRFRRMCGSRRVPDLDRAEHAAAIRSRTRIAL